MLLYVYEVIAWGESNVGHYECSMWSSIHKTLEGAKKEQLRLHTEDNEPKDTLEIVRHDLRD